MAEQIDKFVVFNFLFDDEELEENFHAFFSKYNLNPLFTLEHRAEPITVSHTEALSVTNIDKKYEEKYLNKKYDPKKNKQKKYYTRQRHVKEGSNAKPLKEFANFLSMANDNKMYNSATFKIIYTAKTLTSLVTIIKKVMAYISGDINEKHLFNTWNIVWYDKSIY